MIELETKFAKKNLSLFQKLDQIATCELMETYCNRLERRGKDILYLMKRGVNINLLLKKLGTEDYNIILNDLLEDELAILCDSPYSEEFNVSQKYKAWLKVHTTYEDILAKRIKKEGSKFKIYQGDGFTFNLRKSALQASFLPIRRIHADPEKNGKIIQINSHSLLKYFIIYINTDQKYNLLGVSDLNISSSHRSLGFLGEGSFCRVQKVVDLATKEIYAMKFPQRNLRSTKNGEAIRQLEREMQLWEILKDAEQIGFVGKPLAYIKDPDGSFNAFITKRFSGDLIKLVNDYPYMCTFRGFLTGIIQIATALDTLFSHGIVHRDLKHDNVYYILKKFVNSENKEYKKELICGVGDLGFAEEILKIIDKKETYGYIRSLRIEEEIELLKILYSKEPDENIVRETRLLIEKREIFAFAKMILMALLGVQLGNGFPDMSLLEEEFIIYYGKELFEILQMMLDPSYKKRSTFKEFIEIAKRTLDLSLCEENMKTIFMEIFSKIKMRLGDQWPLKIIIP